MYALNRVARSASRRRRVLASLSNYSAAADSSVAPPTVSRYIVHASGLDRLWIVNDVAEKVIESGGNVAESKAAKLGQYFSLMMLVEVANDSRGCEAEMRTLLSSLPDLNVAIFEAAHTNKAVPSIAYTGYFSVEGADNPGIVHTITSAMASHGLSIERMETDQEGAPMGGTMLFRMKGVCHAFEPLSSQFNPDAIRRDLERLGDSLNCEVTIEDDADDSSSSAFVFE